MAALPKAGAKAVSVIIPSRLALSEIDGNRLFLEDAVRSIRLQAMIDRKQIQIIVGVDAGTVAPSGLAQRLGIDVIESRGRSQAAALNAAAERAEGEFIAFLEDDDLWHRRFLRTTLDALGNAEFASSTQLEVNERHEVVRINDFPTPSGWIMRRETFQAVGRFDESYRWHLDNDWLGRLGESGRSRVHLVESTAPVTPALAAQIRPWLYAVLQHGGPAIRLMRHRSPVPLLVRRVHVGSGLHHIMHDAAANARSREEVARLNKRYGRVPW
jgi:glycosyltransferase involved in cell wall biosynthesis